MNLKKTILVGTFLTIAASALAHQGVTNPAVMKRMDAMSDVKAAMKVLADMAKGVTPFDQSRAVASTDALARLAEQTPDLFRAPEQDPMSEALPKVWESFDDFTAKANEMQRAASNASQSIADITTLQAALGKLGATCKACHSDYRK